MYVSLLVPSDEENKPYFGSTESKQRYIVKCHCQISNFLKMEVIIKSSRKCCVPGCKTRRKETSIFIGFRVVRVKKKEERLG